MYFCQKSGFSEIIALGQIKICIGFLKWAEYHHRREIPEISVGYKGTPWRNLGDLGIGSKILLIISGVRDGAGVDTSSEPPSL